MDLEKPVTRLGIKPKPLLTFLGILLLLVAVNEIFFDQGSKSIPEADNETFDAEIGEYVSYRSNITGLDFEYPENWETKIGHMDSEILLISPKESKQDPFKENINLVIRNIPQNKSMEQMRNRALDKMKKNLHQFELKKGKNTTVLNKKAQEIIFTAESRGIELKWKQIWVKIEDNAYIITFTSQEEKYQKYQPVLERFRKTLTLLS